MPVVATMFPTLKDHLRTNLIARLAALAASVPDATLAEVVVSTAELRIDEAFESIEFGDVESDQDWELLGNLAREEQGTVHGLIWIVKPGSGEDTIKEARDRAVYLLTVVAVELRANIGQWLTSQQANSAVRQCAITNIRSSEFVLPSGRIARVLFDIAYTVRLPTS